MCLWFQCLWLASALSAPPADSTTDTDALLDTAWSDTESPDQVYRSPHDAIRAALRERAQQTTIPAPDRSIAASWTTSMLRASEIRRPIGRLEALVDLPRDIFQETVNPFHAAHQTGSARHQLTHLQLPERNLETPLTFAITVEVSPHAPGSVLVHGRDVDGRDGSLVWALRVNMRETLPPIEYLSRA